MDPEGGLCSRRSFLFWIHPRSNISELLLALLLGPITAFMLTFNFSWILFVVSIFSCYSLLGEPIPELTPYLTNSDFHILSHHYQRVYWLVILMIPKTISFYLNVPYAEWMDYFQISVLVL